MRLAPPQLLEAEPREHLVDARADRRRLPGEVLEAEGDVLLDVLGDELVLGVLEEDPDLAPRRLAAGGGQQVASAGHGPAPGGRPRQAAEQPRQRRLAGPVRPDHGERLARADRQVEPGERVVVRAGVAEVDLLEGYDGLAHLAEAYPTPPRGDGGDAVRAGNT